MKETTEDTEYETLLSQITHEKKRAFLENYPTFCVTTQTAKSIGVDDRTVRRWVAGDDVFMSALSALKKEIDNTRLQRYEAELDRRVLETPSKQSDILLMFGLKAFNPDKYREKPITETRISGNVVIKMDIPPYRDELPPAESKLRLASGTEDSQKAEKPRP